MTPAEIEDFHREVLGPILSAYGKAGLFGLAHQGCKDLELQARFSEAFAEVETQLAQLKLRKLLEAQATPQERPRKDAKWLSLNIDATLAAGLLMLTGAAAATAVGPLALAGYICGAITTLIADLILAPRRGA